MYKGYQMKKAAFYITTIGLGLLCIQTANAATATGTLTVKATVTTSCAVNTSATGVVSNAVLDFGTVSSFTSNVDSDTTATSWTAIKVLCNNGTTYSLAFDGGKNVSSSQRRMTGGSTEYIPYNLYSDSTRATAIAVNGTIAGTGTGAAQTINVYGRIPAGTTLPSASSYVDTVTLTVTY